MRRVNLNRKRNEKGNALIELAVVSIVIIPLFFGMVGIGINLGHMNQAVQISRDVGHMYAKGVDFSQAGNQNIVIDLATGTGITTTGGNGVVTLSQVIQVYQADCNAAGYSSSQCTNLGQLVFINRIVIGNSGLRASNYGTPTSSIVNSSGNIAAADYLTNSSAVVTGTLSSEMTSAGFTLSDGAIAYLSELYLSTPDISYLGTVGSGGVYGKAVF
jgi:Flp pilus assembly protein TadG